VREAALALLNAYEYFPDGTVFLIVVDPGVGTQRRPIAVKAGNYQFVAPDNGVLSYALSQFEDYDAYELTEPQYWLSQLSNTFHGRDIFAPVSAYLASGITCEQVGKKLDTIAILPKPTLIIMPNSIEGEVTDVDRFGNIITSIGRIQTASPERLILTPLFADDNSHIAISSNKVTIRIGGETLQSIRKAYDEALRGQTIALVDSNGFLEVAVNQGNAAQRLDVTIGDQVELIIQT
jgi:S-adenosylmethionine hydrolase